MTLGILLLSQKSRNTIGNVINSISAWSGQAEDLYNLKSEINLIEYQTYGQDKLNENLHETIEKSI